MDLFYSLSGALTGLIVGLTGVGGGALMTPILLLLFGIAPTTAVATDLWFASLTKIAAMVVHHKEQQINWSIVARLWAGSLPAAFVIILLLLSGHLAVANSKFLTSIIGVVIILTALGLLAKNLFQKVSNTAQAPRKYHHLLTTISGAIIGILVAFTSVGAGALGTIVLLYLYPQMTANKLIGTDIAHAIPLALIAGLGYLITGHVNFHLLFLLLLGSIPGAFLGSIIATRFGQKKLRYCLAAILSFSGLKLIF